MRQEIRGRFDKVEERSATLEREVEAIKNAQFGFDARSERIEGDAHESPSIGHNLRADAKILRAEVAARAQDVTRLDALTA